ncbi:cilia- and flagella-associated protein 52 [Lycorma delicatula]|uniref:cilia- and flagella-associated protein 52 n=1 Tax=Lycorma delicatula TaxID=130591 RepID=UPI003F5198D8
MARGDTDVIEVEDLELLSIIGFDGNAPNGLRVHPDGVHIVYPLGSKLVVQNWKTKEQSFLEGHTNVIATVAMSKSGKMIASGQINHMGFKASVIVWDFHKREAIMNCESHKVRVQSVVFSCCEKYLYSLGGPDDSNIIAWHIENKQVLCGSFSSNRISGDAQTLCSANIRGTSLISGGDGNLKVWRLFPEERRMSALDVSLGKIKRIITCMEADYKDEFAYCGTSTGDVIKIKLNYSLDTMVLDPVVNPILIGCYGKISSKKKKYTNKPLEAERYSLGVRALLLLEDNSIVIGAGDGTVDVVIQNHSESDFIIKQPGKLINPCLPILKKLKSTRINGMVTSIQKINNEELLMAGTIKCELYLISLKDLSFALLITCHTSAIYDLTFPHDFSTVFATASKDDIRVWNADTSQELLKISLPGSTCSGIVFTHDGKAIITSWNDGNIRAFTPQTGTLLYTISDAHNKGVSAIAITKDGRKIISGGGEGQVRVWDIKPNKQSLAAVLKEHKGPVSAIDINSSDKEAVTASADGTCIIWDIERYARTAILFSSTLFMCVKYHPTGCQVITCGTNRQIGYWEVFDGSLIREVEGSTSSALNTLDITNDGKYFLTGGTDQILKLWKYHEGVTRYVGVGHAAVITSVRFSPDRQKIISASADGAIFIWNCPVTDYGIPKTVKTPSTASSRSTCSIREAKFAAKKKANSEENINAISPIQSVRSEPSTPVSAPQSVTSVKEHQENGFGTNK